ncbi:MAG: hypothetical protein AABW51_02650 [Nanoarchaeota archaeon]
MIFIKFIIEKLANICLSISNVFNLFSIKLIDKLNINIYKPKYEEKIFQNTESINKDTQQILKNDEDIKRYKEKEKLIKELINRKIINVNNLNKVSNSEHFIVIPKIHLNINDKKVRKILFGEEGSFKNSIFSYFDQGDFVNLGKKFSPIYLKDKYSIKQPYRNISIFKKILDNKLKDLIYKDNKEIVRLIQRHKNRKEIKVFFEGEDVSNKKFLFLDYMIISSLNLNKENITLEEGVHKQFLFKILTKEAQNIKIKEVILESGLKLFLNEEYLNFIKDKLLKNESTIKQKLKIDNFFEDINKNEFEKVLKQLLENDYQQIYSDNFFKLQSLIKEL